MQPVIGRWTTALTALVAVALFGPATAQAAGAGGAASALEATVLGSRTVLASTGPLDGVDDLREASLPSVSVPLVGGAAVLHAASGGSSGAAGAGDSVASEASLADLGLSVAGATIEAGFVMARSLATAGAAPVGVAEVEGLAVNGSPVTAGGAPNQVIPILGGRLIVNEQVTTPDGLVVNALHLVMDGVADVIVASARASAGQAASSPSPLPVPLPPAPHL
jgi:hypothetical protein